MNWGPFFMNPKSLLVTSLLATLAGPALASDPYLPATVYLEEAPLDRWSGFYAGAQIGYGWGSSANVWWNDSTPVTPDGDIAYQGINGGVHAGYQLQSGDFVWGAEADISLTDLYGNDSQFAGLVNEIQIDALATLRARAGMAFDNVLLYGTLGGAAASFTKSDTLGNRQGPQLAAGWTIGAGVEVAVSETMRVRA